MNPEFVYSSFLRWVSLKMSEEDTGKTQKWGDFLAGKVVPFNVVPAPGRPRLAFLSIFIISGVILLVYVFTCFKVCPHLHENRSSGTCLCHLFQDQEGASHTRGNP